MVRAKFTCNKIENGQVSLSAVSDGSEENKEFFKWTPCGQIQIGTINEGALAQFEVGKSYYVDFTQAD